MKINNINNINIDNKSKTPAFKGLGAKSVENMVKATDAIERAGFIAAFVTQDCLGSIIPRILTGLTRNSDKTGELNYKFASLEACREILTGPPTMFIPIATIAYARNHIGNSLKSPVSAIESFSNGLGDIVKNGSSDINDLNNLKQSFYSKTWEKTLIDSCGKDYTPKKGLIEKLTSLMTELETSRNYTFKDKIHHTPKFRTTNDIIGDITNLVSEELRSNADVTGSFARVTYKDGVNKPAQSAIGAFTGHMSDYVKDIMKNVKNIEAPSATKITETIVKVKNNRVVQRVILNFVSLGAVLLYSTVVPKLYKSLNKTNPGLIGLTDDDKPKIAENNKKSVNYEAFDKIKDDNNNNKIAFKGLGLGKLSKIIQKDGAIRKFANAYEFNGINMSYATLMTFMGLGILVPRVANAYDKHDKREILTRDILTIAALVYGSKALLKNIANFFEKKLGIVLSEKPEGYFQKTKTKQFFDRLKPFSGTQVFSNNDIALKYTNIEKFKNGFAGFCEFISKSGGDLVKFFSNDKTTKENMEKMLGKALNKSTREEIMQAVADKKNAEFVNNIINVFKNPNNTFVKKAKSITGVFGFVSTFIAIPGFMIFLQKFNEKVTKRAIAKEQAEKRALDQKFTAIKLTYDLLKPEQSKLKA